ncbi:MAG: hypothetical protein WD696_11595 [Bryobacteraceae bacterium]
MTQATAQVPVTPPKPHSRRQSIALVFCCTLLGAAAQILMKAGANVLTGPGPLGFLTNPALLAGYALYGLSTLLLVLALRDGELSILYPVIALTYVWVTICSRIFFRESVNPLKIVGISIIVIGVGVLGRGSRK